MPDNQLYIERGERLKILREQYFKVKTASDFAEMIGVAQSNYSIIEKGQRDIASKILEFISNQYNVNLNWLLFGKGEMLNNVIDIVNTENKEPNVKFLNIAAFAGHSIAEKNYEVEKWVYIPGLAPKQDYYGISVDGNSMIPTLNDGDFIICYPLTNIAEDFKHGQVYVLVLRDRILVKRVFVKEGSIQLTSDNPFFKPELINHEEIVKMFVIKIRITPFSK